MTWAENYLRLLLRISATTLLLAIVPTLIPHAWMNRIHYGMGLAELPAIPIVGYLTRSLSALYAVHGALLLFISFDVRRYVPLVRFLAAVSGCFGAFLLVLDVLLRMPLWWTLCEGPLIIAVYGLMFWLATRSNDGPNGT
jgi:hypothetical protein